MFLKGFVLYRIYAILLFTAALLFLSLETDRFAMAYDDTPYSITGNCTQYDSNFTEGTCGPPSFQIQSSYFPSEGVYDQMYKIRLHGVFASNGDTVGAAMCLSSFQVSIPDIPSVDAGLCWSLLSGYDASEGGLVDNTQDIGLDYTLPYKYASAWLYAKAASWTYIQLDSWGRRVSVDRFDADPTVNTGNPFNVNWWVSNVGANAQISWDSLVSANGGVSYGPDSQPINPNPGSPMVFTAGPNTGTTRLTLNGICGPTGDGYHCIPDPTFDVIIVAGAPGPFDLTSSTCYDTGKYDLSWGESSNATSYEVWNHAWSFGAWNLVTTLPGNARSYTDQESMGTDWYFKVVAKNNSGSTNSNPNPNDRGVWGGQCPLATAAITCNPGSIDYGASSTIGWTCTDANSGSVSPGGWTGTSGSHSTGALTGSTTYTATCVGPSNTATANCTVSVSAPVYGCTNPAASNYNPNADIDDGSCSFACPGEPGAGTQSCTSGANACGQTATGTQTRTCNHANGTWGAWGACSVGVPPNTCVPTPAISCSPGTVGYGGASTIAWSCTNSSAGSVSPTGWTGTSNAGISTGALTSNQTYTLTCTGYNGTNPTANCPVTVTAPTVDIKCNGSNGPITLAWNSSANLSWTSSNAASCTKSGDWSGSATPNVPGSQSTGNLTNPKTYNYTLACSGNGSASDTCQVILSPPIPNDPTNATATEPDYCASGPAATVSWTYSDPSGSPQSAYQVQITNTGNFNNPILDTGKINSGSGSYFTGQGVLQFDTTYKARVKVWNSYDVASGWSNASSTWKTPPYAYPQTDFSWTANGILNNPSPPLNKLTQFTDTTVFGGNPNGRRWSWILGEGATSTTQNPSHTYVAEGSYYITLTATDNANQSCARTKGPLIIQKPIPKWREIAPK